MKISRKRIILTIVLAVLFVIAFGWIIMMLNHATLVRNHVWDDTLKLEEVTHTLEDIRSKWSATEKRIRDRYAVDATLSALALRSDSAWDGEGAAAPDPDGAGVKVDSGDIEASVDIPAILRKAETAYNVYAMCTAADPSSENGQRILYSSDIFADLEEILAKTGMENLSGGDEEENNGYHSGTLTLQEGTFRYVRCAVPEIGGYLVLLSIQPNLYVKALSQGTYMFAVLILFITPLLTAGFALYRYIRENELTPFTEKRYTPANVRRFAVLCGVIGTILIFLSGILIYSLNGLYDDTARGKERLRMLDESLDMNAARVRQNMDRFEEVYTDYGTRIADALDAYPELREKAVLETLAENISASSITLYDADGRETVSSGDYIGLYLSRDPESVTYDFRRILNGVPCIIHDPETDEITGLNEIRVGMRIRDAEDPARYGAMIIAVEPEAWAFDASETTDSVLKSLSEDGVTLCIADPESGEILFSGSEDLIGRDISVLGLGSAQLQGSVLQNVKTDDGTMFVTSSVLQFRDAEDVSGETAGRIAFYAAPRVPLLAGMLASALVGSLLFVVIYVVLAHFVLGPYTDEYFELNKRMNPAPDRKPGAWAGVRHYLTTIRPENIVLITMEIITGLYLTQQIPIANFTTALSRNSVYYYLTSGSWEKGLNLFALAGSLLLLGQIVMAVILMRILLTVIATFMGSKGVTICRLLRSLCMYLALFGFIILGLTYTGIQISVILGAIATLGIAVSLGAQHFVSDIIAGLTMVFEGIIHAGDIVDLGVGMKVYHGEVKEIGLRFVRIETAEGNIVTLSNRDITMSTNMTRMNSLCVCEFAVSAEYSIDDIEAMLQRELPVIGEKDRRILKGPVYNGIVALEGGTMTLSVTAECREQDISDVHRLINRSLQQIFTRNGYRIGP